MKRLRKLLVASVTGCFLFYFSFQNSLAQNGTFLSKELKTLFKRVSQNNEIFLSLIKKEKWRSSENQPEITISERGLFFVNEKQEQNVYSYGQLRVLGTCCYDLDFGKRTKSFNPPADFFWEQVTTIKRCIVPLNGAKFYIIGIVDFNSIKYSHLKTYCYSSNKINGSNTTSNQIPEGTVVAAITNEGRYCKFRIDQYGYNLTITYLTYNKE